MRFKFDIDWRNDDHLLYTHIKCMCLYCSNLGRGFLRCAKKVFFKGGDICISTPNPPFLGETLLDQSA